MLGYRGDWPVGAVVRFSFNTRDASGNPITLAGTPDLAVYVGGSTSVCNILPTLVVNYNSVTGRHVVTIDTSVTTTPTGFYAAGNDYEVVLTAGTVSGTSVVGITVGSFSINNRTEAGVLTAVGSPMQASIYTAPPTVTAIQSGLALHSDVTAMESSLATIIGLSGGGGAITVGAFNGNALLAFRQALTGAVVTVAGPVSGQPGQGLTLKMVIGDDYTAADSRAIVFDLAGTVLPDLTTATVALVCELSGRTRSQVLISGEIIVPTGTTRVVQFEPLAAQTLLLSPTVDGEFSVVITLASGRTITPFEAMGTLVVLQGKRPVSNFNQ